MLRFGIFVEAVIDWIDIENNELKLFNDISKNVHWLLYEIIFMKNNGIRIIYMLY